MSPSASPVGIRNPRLPCSGSSVGKAFVYGALAIILHAAHGTPVLRGADRQSEAAEHADEGLQLARTGDLAAAKAELRKAEQLAPGDAHILADLGTVLARESKLEDSTRVFERALKLDPDDITVRRYLAANLWQLNRYREARQNLELIVNRHPEDKQSRLLLGMVAENTQDYLGHLRSGTVVSAEILWPSGRLQKLSSLEIHRYHHIKESIQP
jgi:tetratricopeptide (TPR) repeat protein